MKKTSQPHDAYDGCCLMDLPSGYVKIAIENCNRNSGFIH